MGSDIDRKIYDLANKGNVQQLENLLTKQRFNPNAKFEPNDNNALHVAKKNTATIDKLIKAGFPLDAKNSKGQTTLAVIIKNYDEDRVLPNIIAQVEQAPAEKQPSILINTIKAVQQTQYPEQNSEDQNRIINNMVYTLQHQLNLRLQLSPSGKRNATAIDNSPISITGFTPPSTPGGPSSSKKPRLER